MRRSGPVHARSFPARWALRAALVLWEAPQNMLGALNLALVRAFGAVKRVDFADERVMVELWPLGNPVSLGLFVFYCLTDESKYVAYGAENRGHEFGHSIQSRWLGPLYLLAIGVPSTLRVLYAVGYRHLRGRRWGGYYAGFPEKWADELGGADLSLRPAP